MIETSDGIPVQFAKHPCSEDGRAFLFELSISKQMQYPPNCTSLPIDSVLPALKRLLVSIVLCKSSPQAHTLAWGDARFQCSIQRQHLHHRPNIWMELPPTHLHELQGTSLSTASLIRPYSALVYQSSWRATLCSSLSSCRSTTDTSTVSANRTACIIRGNSTTDLDMMMIVKAA